MYRALTCLTEEHVVWTLPLASVVCWVSCHTALRFLAQSGAQRASSKLVSLLAGGLSAGAGAWSTHFIGMLGYDPGIGIGYDPTITLLSLVLAVVVVLAALMLARGNRRFRTAVIAGVLFGLGTAVTHFTGMAGVRAPGTFVWDPALISASIAFGCTMAITAFVVVARSPSSRSLVVGSTLLGGSIIGLHFFAMAALEIVPDPTRIASEQDLPKEALAFAIAAVMLLVLVLGVLVRFVSRLQRMNVALQERRVELREQAALLDATLENMDQGLMMIDQNGIVRVCNKRAVNLLDLPPAIMRRQPKFEQVRNYQLAAGEFEKSDDILRRRVATVGFECHAGIYERERPNGTILEIRTVPLEGGGAVRTYTDITQRKAAEVQIAHMARHDDLTALPNRMLFRERLEQRLAEIDSLGGDCWVLCLDLDRFKVVNDTLGHLAGDAVLREAARRLSAVLGVGDVLARLGGDEFAVMLLGAGGKSRVTKVAESLVRAIRTAFIVKGQEVEIGVSIGIARAPEHGRDIDSIVKRADVALYRAKSNGRNTFRFFEPAMDEEEAEQRTLETDLRRAIQKDELILHYQPQVNSATGDLIGFEALVRWQHPTRGLIPPSTFIPVAEETGMIVALGDWVMRTACAEAASWSRPLNVAVNLSPRQFHKDDFTRSVQAILLETGLPPARLELEITETVIISDMDRALGVLNRLKTMGIRIGMDDFGTGYSSLATLLAFPFDKIKIDRSFVSRMEWSSEAAAIVRAVLGLGRSLGIAVTAEGVETAEQMRLLVEARCDEAQGYLLGKPEPIESFHATVHGLERPPWESIYAGSGLTAQDRRNAA